MKNIYGKFHGKKRRSDYKLAITVTGVHFHFGQCSPYQAVTGKIYRLKRQFLQELPPATP